MTSNAAAPGPLDSGAEPNVRAVTTGSRSPHIPTSAAVKRLSSWHATYARRLLVTDVLAIAAACFASQAIWIHDGNRPLAHNGRLLNDVTYTIVTLVFIAVWLLLLAAFSTREHKTIGSGSLEYRRVADATLMLFGVGASLAYLFQAQLGRGYFLTILPLGLALLLGTRYSWRQWLNHRRRFGEYTSRALLLGRVDIAQQFARAALRNTESGLKIVGAVLDGRTARPRLELTAGIPILGDTDHVLEALDHCEADTLVVVDTHGLSHSEFRRLGWQLEQRGINLIVSPAITDIAGPRIHSRPVAGLPLIYIDFPALDGRKLALKRTFDIVGSLLLITVLLPVFIPVGLAVKLTSRGPMFYGQERIGRGGNPFRMLKFRSMLQGADDQLQTLLDAQGTSDRPLFKINNDPRITPVGRFIRKHSLDELPQLANVLLGDMSLVGPRPQRAKEVALYNADAHRRHVMKPGMSGLWQVSGRSKLTWEDAIRLDLYYVENWSLTSDVAILWRTFRVVLFGDGAE